MSAKILYYPYINIPKVTWTHSSILYWDEVGLIMPSTYIYKPNELEGYTRDLIHSGLIKQVFPEPFVHKFPSFTDSIVEFILNKDTFNLPKAIESFKANNVGNIHIQKSRTCWGIKFWSKFNFPNNY